MVLFDMHAAGAKNLGIISIIQYYIDQNYVYYMYQTTPGLTQHIRVDFKSHIIIIRGCCVRDTHGFSVLRHLEHKD